MLTRNALITAKVESSYGVDSVPSAATNAILVANPQVKIDGEVLTRDNLRATLSPQQHVIGRKKATVTFETEIKGSGAEGVAPAIGVLFAGCGFEETIVTDTSVTYSPISTGQESLTIYVYFDGLLHKITGARGSVSGDVGAGKYGKLSWSFEGAYATPTDTALPSSPSFESTTPPIAVAASFSVGGYSAVIDAIAFDIANSLAANGDINASDGYGEIQITGRDSNGSFAPEATLIATEDFWSDWEDATAKSISFTIGSAPGNRCAITIGQAVYREIGYGDREGVKTYEIPFTAAATSAGDDEISFVFT